MARIKYFPDKPLVKEGAPPIVWRWEVGGIVWWLDESALGMTGWWTRLVSRVLLGQKWDRVG